MGEFLKIRGEEGYKGHGQVRGHGGSGRSTKSLVGLTWRPKEGSVEWGSLGSQERGALKDQVEGSGGPLRKVFRGLGRTPQVLGGA